LRLNFETEIFYFIIKQNFTVVSLDIHFQVVLKSLNAIVTSTNEVFPNDELEVQSLSTNDNISSVKIHKVFLLEQNNYLLKLM